VALVAAVLAYYERLGRGVIPPAAPLSAWRRAAAEGPAS
jgi:hypothetical protein